MNKALRITLVLTLVFAAACSTEKNTSMSRNYHNLVSHYNIYFNGSESLKKGVNQAGKSFQDNFTRILPLFYFSSPQVSQSITPAMDRSIEKATKVITLHSITAKPEIKRGNLTEKQKEFYNKKEFNKWVDDNYILMGKAYVYENKFKLAIETFKKVVADFPDEPIRYEALIWMARAYNELGDYRESQNILEIVKNAGDLPQEYQGEFYTTYADFFIKQDKYEQAIPQLEKGLELTRSKDRRIRYTFILAQLYQETGNSEMAVENYQQVIHMNPPYEMTFNAKINMARSYKAGSGKEKEIVSTLEKMLKDDKNNEFQDQIYYALGKIALKEGDTSTAIENFKMSAAKSVSNYNQKGLTYLELGDIYYEKPDYPLAQAYYDSTIQNIDKDYDDFEMLSVKTRSLTNLVKHLNVYTLEDSLQTLAALPETERLARIDKIIENVKKQEEDERLRKQEEMQNAQYGSMGMNARANTANNQQGGKWYFYNLNAKGFGQPEFRMHWGNRKLEDNWRRSNKQTMDMIEQNQEAESADSTSQKKTAIFSNKSREFYLKGIPLNDSALAVSGQKLENALYNMGLVYRNELKDNKEAVKTFEEQVRRYPGGPNSLMAYYNLYELYNLKGDRQKSDYFKDLIIRTYPDNPRAKILANPSYAKEMMAEQNKVLDLYEKVYQEYQDDNYSAVVQDANYALRTYPGDKTVPRFRLLRALAIGGLQGKEALKDELQKVVKEFPKHEVSDFARNLIKEIYTMAPELEKADTQKKAEQIYSYVTGGSFIFGVAVANAEDVNQMNFNIINFNLDNFNRLNLGIENQTIGKQSVLLVKSFSDLQSAKRYLETFKNDTGVYRSLDPANIRPFIISDSNYGILANDLDFEKYYLFYKKYYQP
ncbi:MAG TPA: tetratricopeptide repeat protein [Bacteroidales bacterium]|nr:tetratricopeptide repeat protein [Bacteroidales bacterium]